jgi:hypothetical protein
VKEKEREREREREGEETKREAFLKGEIMKICYFELKTS